MYEHRELLFTIGERRVVRVVLYVDWLRANRVVPALPPPAGWRTGSNPSHPHTLESVAPRVRVTHSGLRESAAAGAAALSRRGESHIIETECC